MLYVELSGLSALLLLLTLVSGCCTDGYGGRGCVDEENVVRNKFGRMASNVNSKGVTSSFDLRCIRAAFVPFVSISLYDLRTVSN